MCVSHSPVKHAKHFSGNLLDLPRGDLLNYSCQHIFLNFNKPELWFVDSIFFEELLSIARSSWSTPTSLAATGGIIFFHLMHRMVQAHLLTTGGPAHEQITVAPLLGCTFALWLLLLLILFLLLIDLHRSRWLSILLLLFLLILLLLFLLLLLLLLLSIAEVWSCREKVNMLKYNTFSDTKLWTLFEQQRFRFQKSAKDSKTISFRSISGLLHPSLPIHPDLALLGHLVSPPVILLALHSWPGTSQHLDRRIWPP